MNIRQLRLKNMIDSGNVPTVIDASVIAGQDEESIPFHWGDLEVLGYGKTARHWAYRDTELIITRTYTGPGSIMLIPQNLLMNTNDVYQD